MALFEWVAAMEMVCKDSAEGDKGRFILLIKDITIFLRPTGTL